MQNKTYEFITNNFSASAEEIAGIYKARWDIELFFKHIKQNLKIKHFYGTSENAVKTQIWIAMISVLLVNYVRFISKSLFSNTEIIRVIRENMFSGKSLRDLICPVKHQPLSDKGLNCEIQGCIWS
jgi:putative transposase